MNKIRREAHIMKKVITMVLAFAMVLAGSVIPVDRVSAQSNTAVDQSTVTRDDGAKVTTTTFDDGTKDISIVYPNGSNELIYRDGLHLITEIGDDGTETVTLVSPDGTKRISEIRVTNPDGSQTQTYFESNGSKYITTIYKDGSKTLTTVNVDGTSFVQEYDENGKIKSTEEYEASGKLISRYEYGDGNDHKIYDADGLIYCMENGVVTFAKSPYTYTTDDDGTEKVWDKDGNMIGLYEDGVWKKFTWDGLDTTDNSTFDDDGTYKLWDTKGNLIYQENPDGTVVIDKRMKKEIVVDEGGGKDSNVLVGGEDGNVNTFMVTEGFTSKKKLRCVGDGAVLNVKWSSSNPSIAAVSETGIVTGKKAGKATLTATVIASGQQVKVPVKVVKNKCYGTRDCDGTKVSGSISYDKKGNLVCKFKIKNTTKKKLKYVRKDNKLSFTISDGKHKNKSTSKRFGFTLKRGKSKTVTITIKKSKLKAKYNLPESDIRARLFIDATHRSSILTYMGFTVDGK